MNLSLSLSPSISHMKNTADFFPPNRYSTLTQPASRAGLLTHNISSAAKGCLTTNGASRAAESPCAPTVYTRSRRACIDNACRRRYMCRSFVRPSVSPPSLSLSLSLLFPHFNICGQPYQTVCRLSSSSPGAATRTCRRRASGRAWKCEFPSQNPFSRVKCGIRGMRRQNIWRGLISGSVDGIGEGEGEGE